jgi:hypothetical protein
MQCVAIIIQLVSRDHVCRFESESDMEKCESLRENHAVIKCTTTFWGLDGYEWIENIIGEAIYIRVSDRT